MQVTDPVCGMTLDSGKAAAKEISNDETYYFFSASCHDQFTAVPERYTKKTADSAQASRRPAQ